MIVHKQFKYVNKFPNLFRNNELSSGECLSEGYMSDYNLNALNTRDFEHLVQSLAIGTIGSGVSPFGDGPDGGREATFKGRTNYKSPEHTWEGYLVIQCKFCTKPTGETKKDGEWALNELKKEIEKYINKKRRIPKPDYYIFVTNVVLSAVLGSGGFDKINNYLKDNQNEIEYKDWDIWEYNKICRLLDNHDSIRKKYLAFISSGDVLAEIQKSIKMDEKNFDSVISNFLQQEFLADQYVKLEQAGHSSEYKTPIANVFVDLPASKNPNLELNPHKVIQYDAKYIVREVLENGDSILSRKEFEGNLSFIDDPELKHDVGRYVLVGGPGQGKSTVGQFLCQLYRSSILSTRQSSRISSEIMEPLQQFIKNCREDNISLPFVKRFPFRIILEQFADALANGKVKSLLSYIQHRIANRIDYDLTQSDIRKWLIEYPWFIVLDGLDEVPATSNRKVLLEKIRDFLIELTTVNADLLLLATTRPQGYGNEFSLKFYDHRYLLPLSKELALYYSQKLVNSKFGNDIDRCNRILKRLNTACEQETTQRLMQSPLQVTIMATLVDKIGQPPLERWRLFQEYYEVIYSRETEREIPASRILQMYKADVLAIHQRVALSLQLKGEKPGSTESIISPELFKQLVQSRISEEGHEGEELINRTNEIVDAALHRLVFLVGLEENKIGFEIRSLQEFMAAEALMNGSEEPIRKRLLSIAPILYWRNVFLFAVGKCFAERQFLRDMILVICQELNDEQNDKLFGAVKVGSRLALDILEEGVAQQQPKYERLFVDLAFKIINIADKDVVIKLASIYRSSLEKIFFKKMEDFRRQGDKNKINLWHMLITLINRDIKWAKTLFNQNWPENLAEQIDIIGSYRHTSKFLIPISEKLIPQLPFFSLILSTPNREDLLNLVEVSDWYKAYTNYFDSLGELNSVNLRIFNSKLRFNIRFLKDANLYRIIPLKDIPTSETTWFPYIAGARFAQDPVFKNFS